MKMKRILTCVLSLFCWIIAVGIVKGQTNLITNWSFEDTIPCINNPNPFDPESAPPWVSVCQSPDYLSNSYCGMNTFAWGYQMAKSGIAAVGFSGFTTVAPNYIREVFSQQLTDTLIAGHKYCVTFNVCHTESSKLAVDRIGALFTSFAIDYIYVFSFTGIPQIQNPPGNIISDTTNWTLISGDLIAQGNEQYISIGNFYDDANTQFIQVPWGVYDESYYYVDDISVTDCTVGLSETPVNNFEIYPNPVSFGSQLTVSVQTPGAGMGQIKIFSVEGKLVFAENLQAQDGKYIIKVDFEPGVYFMRIESDMGSGTRKFVVLD